MNRVKADISVIVLAQIAHTLRFADTLILTRHVVGHEIDNHLQASTMRAADQFLKLQHTFLDIDSQVWVDVIIVCDGIRRTCPTLDHSWMLTRDTIARIVCHRGMTDDTRIPDMSHAQLPDLLQGAGREVVQFSTSVLLYRTINLAGIVTITKESGENLIDDDFMRCHAHSLPC